MTMYLPNPDLQPTGSEAIEFIDVPPMAETLGKANGPIERREGTTMPMDTQTRLNITRWAEEYISGLVENHNGDPEDVRSIIHELHDQGALRDNDAERSMGPRHRRPVPVDDAVIDTTDLPTSAPQPSVSP